MARDLYELAKGSRRRSSATVASAIAQIEREIDETSLLLTDRENADMAMESIVKLKQLASALRWVLGDEYDEQFARDVFGEDSAGL